MCKPQHSQLAQLHGAHCMGTQGNRTYIADWPMLLQLQLHFAPEIVQDGNTDMNKRRRKSLIINLQ
jgi:hypothetical protein